MQSTPSISLKSQSSALLESSGLPGTQGEQAERGPRDQAVTSRQDHVPTSLVLTNHRHQGLDEPGVWWFPGQEWSFWGILKP